jgi:hypothetical protein
MTHGPQGLFGRGTTTNQVQLVSKAGALTAQRQAIAQTIAKAQGNQQVARVVAQTHNVVEQKQQGNSQPSPKSTASAVTTLNTPARGASVAQRKASTQHKNGDSKGATTEAAPTNELDVMGGSASGASFAAAGTPPPDSKNSTSSIVNSRIQRANPNPDGSFVADAAVEQRINTQQGAGSPLPDETRNFMESRFSADFSDVRVHTGGEAAQLNRSLQARAFTRGQDIFFGEGNYNPSADEGRQLLAHELTHVVQQGSAAPLAPEGNGAAGDMEQGVGAGGRETGGGGQGTGEQGSVGQDASSPASSTTASENELSHGVQRKPVSTNNKVGGATKPTLHAKKQSKKESASPNSVIETAKSANQAMTAAKDAQIKQSSEENRKTKQEAAEGKNIQAEKQAQKNVTKAAEGEAKNVEQENKGTSAAAIAGLTADKEKLEGEKQTTAGKAQAAGAKLNEVATKLLTLQTASVQFAPTQDESQREDAALSAQFATQFVSRNSQAITDIIAIGQTIEGQIKPAVQQAQTNVQNAIKENKVTVKTAVNQARGNVSGQAKWARGQVKTKYDATTKAIGDDAKTARDDIKKDYDAKLTDLENLEKAQPALLQKIFEAGAGKFSAAGKEVGDEAVAIGARYQKQYGAEPLKEPGTLDGADYYIKKRNAKVEAAKQVAEQYSKEYVAQGEAFAKEIVKGSKEVDEKVKEYVKEARDALKSEFDAANTDVNASEKQALDAAKSTYDGQIKSIDQSEKGSLKSLSQLQVRLNKQIEEAGKQVVASLERNGQTLMASLQQAVADTADSLQQSLSDFIAQSQSKEAPASEAMSEQLTQSQTQLDGMHAQAQADLQKQIGDGVMTTQRSGEQGVAQLNQIGQSADEQAKPISTQFGTSMGGLVGSATKAFDSTQKDNNKSVKDRAKTAQTRFKDAYDKGDKQLSAIRKGVEDQLEKNAKDFKDGEGGLRTAMQKGSKETKPLEQEIKDKAQEASDAVAPAWKEVVAFVLTVIITVVVAIAIAALAASGVGLGLGLLLAAGIGAVGGIAKGLIENWRTNKPVTLKDVGKWAVTGAIDGMLQFAGGRYIKFLKLPDTGWKQLLIRQGINGAQGFVNDLVNLGFEGQLTWKNVGKSLLQNTISTVLNIGGAKFVDSRNIQNPIKKKLVEAGVGTVTDTLGDRELGEKLIDGKLTAKDVGLSLLKNATQQGISTGANAKAESKGYNKKLEGFFDEKFTTKPPTDPTKTPPAHGEGGAPKKGEEGEAKAKVIKPDDETVKKTAHDEANAGKKATPDEESAGKKSSLEEEANASKKAIEDETKAKAKSEEEAKTKPKSDEEAQPKKPKELSPEEAAALAAAAAELANKPKPPQAPEEPKPKLGKHSTPAEVDAHLKGDVSEHELQKYWFEEGNWANNMRWKAEQLSPASQQKLQNAREALLNAAIDHIKQNMPKDKVPNVDDVVYIVGSKGVTSDRDPTFTGPHTIELTQLFNEGMQKALTERGLPSNNWRDALGINPYIDNQQARFAYDHEGKPALGEDAQKRLNAQEYEQLQMQHRAKLLAEDPSGAKWKQFIEDTVKHIEQIDPDGAAKARQTLEQVDAKGKAGDADLTRAAKEANPLVLEGMTDAEIIKHLHENPQAMREARTRLLDEEMQKLAALQEKVAKETGGDDSKLTPQQREAILAQTMKTKSFEEEAYHPSAIESVVKGQQEKHQGKLEAGQTPEAQPQLTAEQRMNSLLDNTNMLDEHVGQVKAALEGGASPEKAVQPIAKYLARALLEARELGIPVGGRYQLLGDLSRKLRTKNVGQTLGEMKEGKGATMTQAEAEAIVAAATARGLTDKDGKMSQAQLEQFMNEVHGLNEAMRKSIAARQALELGGDLRPDEGHKWRAAGESEATETPSNRRGVPTPSKPPSGEDGSAPPTTPKPKSSGELEEARPLDEGHSVVAYQNLKAALRQEEKISNARAKLEEEKLLLPNDELHPNAMKNAELIIEGPELGPKARNELTKDGSPIEDWGKYTTKNVKISPKLGNVEIHFYMNKKTGEINTSLDYKYKIQNKGEPALVVPLAVKKAAPPQAGAPMPETTTTGATPAKGAVETTETPPSSPNTTAGQSATPAKSEPSGAAKLKLPMQNVKPDMRIIKDNDKKDKEAEERRRKQAQETVASWDYLLP